MKLMDRHYIVKRYGWLQTGQAPGRDFRGLEGRLKQQASAERIGVALGIVLQASEKVRT